MSRDTDQLTRQVEAMLTPLADRLDRVPPPGEAVVERVKAAVRHEINEEWLAQRTPVHAPRELLDRVHAAVHATLHRDPVSAPYKTPIAGLAAAAMMAICAGLIWQVGALHLKTGNDRGAGALIAAQPVDLFVEAAEVSLASVVSENNNRALSGSQANGSSDVVLDELNEAVQDVLSEPEPKDSTMGDWPVGQGVLG